MVASRFGVFIGRFASSPALNIARPNSQTVISWIVPSQDFVLEQNSDMTTTNWTDVPTTPLLNLSNLQNQVFLAPTNGSRFYRLKH